MKGIIRKMEKSKNTDIKINKKLRLWNKYKNFMVGFAGILIVIFIVTMLFKGCDRNSTEEKTKATPKVTEAETSSNVATQPSTGTGQTLPIQNTTVAQTGNKVYTTTKTLAKEDFTASEFYSKSVFLGDAVVNGIEYYGFLGPDKIVSATNMTTDKATDYLADIVTYGPDKIFIMLGINDLNYGTRGVDTIVSNYAKLISDIKAKLPNAKIYIVSVLPITKDYESKSTVYIRKSNLDDLNNKLKGIVTTSGVDFIDIAAPFTDGTGYLNTNVTSNGLNITTGYYGFLLNTIADMLK